MRKKAGSIGGKEEILDFGRKISWTDKGLRSSQGVKEGFYYAGKEAITRARAML